MEVFTVETSSQSRNAGYALKQLRNSQKPTDFDINATTLQFHYLIQVSESEFNHQIIQAHHLRSHLFLVEHTKDSEYYYINRRKSC